LLSSYEHVRDLRLWKPVQLESREIVVLNGVTVIAKVARP
jgi:hypothetical protein